MQCSHEMLNNLIEPLSKSFELIRDVTLNDNYSFFEFNTLYSHQAGVTNCKNQQ